MISNKLFVPLLLAISFTVSAMEDYPAEPKIKFKHAPEQSYPDGMDFIPAVQVMQEIDIIPDEVRQHVNHTYNTSRSYFDTLTPNKSFSLQIGQYTIYCAGKSEISRNVISSLGHDPYSKTLPASIATDMAAYKGPVIHTSTIAIANHLLKKRGFKTIKTLPTWLYHIVPRPVELDDRHYFLVQDRVSSEFKPFAKLTPDEKRYFIKNMDLEEFYTAIRAIHYAFPDENNIYVDYDQESIMLPTPISPDNEGLGQKARFGKAILGQDASKAQHNLRNPWDGGHRVFGQIVTEHGSESDLEEWHTLYENDTQRD